MGMVQEFKNFAMKGNVLDLAVGVIIGGAFGKIVDSLVKDILMPLVGLALGGLNFSALALTVKEATVKYGAFIQASVDFLAIAFVLFFIIRLTNRFKQEAPPAPAAPAPTPEDVVLLREIRDLLKKQ